MKKLWILLLCCALGTTSAWAQGYVFVDSELVFKSLTEYNSAIEKIDDLATAYQKNIDEAYATIEQAYENYEAQYSYLSETNRSTREQELQEMEDKVTAYSEAKFGQEGELMKMRTDLIKPIQDRVFAAINSYAEKGGYTMVVDVKNNQTLLYYAPSLNKTEEIINLLKL